MAPPEAGAAHQFSISIGEDPDTRVYIRDNGWHPLLTAVELNLHFALDYRMKWDYIVIRGRALLW